MEIDTTYHKPVMLGECLESLDIKPNGTYIDVTFGGGGHSKHILSHLHNGKLYSFDQDSDAEEQAEPLKSNQNFQFVAANFRHIAKYMKLYGQIGKVDGILADLGVSSHQFDTAERGFSIRFDAQLDMRMNNTVGISAKDIINDYSEADLHKLFGIYGEIKNAKTLAQQVVRERARKKIETVFELKEAVRPVVKRGEENKYYAQMFQALRIEANDELKALEEMLEATVDILKPGGRLVVMSYHSLEDRLVKNFIAKGKFHGDVEKDFYGNEKKPFDTYFKKPIEASPDEVITNNRARSAKLRVGIKR